MNTLIGLVHGGDPRHCLSRQQERHQVNTLIGLVHGGDPRHGLSRQGGCNKKSIRSDLSRLSLRAGSRHCYPLQSIETAGSGSEFRVPSISKFFYLKIYALISCNIKKSIMITKSKTISHISSSSWEVFVATLGTSCSLFFSSVFRIRDI